MILTAKTRAPQSSHSVWESGRAWRSESPLVSDVIAITHCEAESEILPALPVKWQKAINGSQGLHDITHVRHVSHMQLTVCIQMVLFQ